MTVIGESPLMFAWYNAQAIQAVKFVCFRCNTSVSSNQGYSASLLKGSNAKDSGVIAVCPGCTYPNTFINGVQHPSPALGRAVEHLPDGVREVYDEARRCFSASSPTAATLILRRLLMFMAAESGADPEGTFKQHVDHLEKAGYVPPGAKDWLTRIRDKGNDAAHRLPHVESQEAEELLDFAEMLLRFKYEFAERMKARAKNTEPAT